MNAIEIKDEPITKGNEEVFLLNTSRNEIPSRYYIYIPKNLDVDVLIGDNPPEIKCFHKDKLKYIVSQLYSIPVRLKDFDFESSNGYVPINAEILKKRVRKYNEYLQFLCDKDVFEKRVDFKYQSGRISTSYRFSARYNTEPKRTYITWHRLIKAICGGFHESKEKFVNPKERPLEYLEKWWNEKLQFDYYGAKKWLRKELCKDRLAGKVHAVRKYNIRLMVVEKFRAKEYVMHQDCTAGRVHNLLTQLKSELRQFIKYDGKTLVAVDITNSQPYMILSLLSEKSFIQNNISDKINHYNSHHTTNSSIMLALSDDNFKEKDSVKNFTDLVKSGKFYENFAALLVERGNLEPADPETLRKQAKKIMFASLFGHNNAKCEVIDEQTGKKEYVPNEGMLLFKETFPEVFQILKEIKKGKHNTLACMLQNLEAELVLHRACKIISDEKPDVPIFTLHDSIITTEENAKYVKRVLCEVLTEAIGIEPTIHTEIWSKTKVA